MLTQAGSLERQRRLRQVLADRELDAAVLTDHRDIYYFTGTLLPERFPVCLLLRSDGGSWLVATSDKDVLGVEECLTYEWNKLGTLNFDPLEQLAAVVGLPDAEGVGLDRRGSATDADPQGCRRNRRDPQGRSR